mgnify:CR=1 FL=1
MNFVSHKYILSGDNHKYVTWSMRFVNKEVAANEVEADRAFLFESMKSKHVSGYNNSAMGDIASYICGLVENAEWLFSSV